jgi:hypothetical protein
MSQDDDRLGGFVAGAAVTWLGGWLCSDALERLIAWVDRPDANSDGKFTISDVGQNIGEVIWAPGERLQSYLAEFQNGVADTDFGKFWEMSGDAPVGLIAPVGVVAHVEVIGLSIIAYFILVFGIFMICFTLFPRYFD